MKTRTTKTTLLPSGPASPQFFRTWFFPLLYGCIHSHVPLFFDCLYLLLGDSLVQRDERSNSSSNQDSLIASIESRVNPSHMLEINESSKCDVLSKDHVCQQGFRDVESQWVKGIVEMCRVAASASWLARKIDEISRSQWDNESSKGPKQCGTPE